MWSRNWGLPVSLAPSLELWFHLGGAGLCHFIYLPGLSCSLPSRLKGTGPFFSHPAFSSPIHRLAALTWGQYADKPRLLLLHPQLTYRAEVHARGSKPKIIPAPIYIKKVSLLKSGSLSLLSTLHSGTKVLLRERGRPDR